MPLPKILKNIRGGCLSLPVRRNRGVGPSNVVGQPFDSALAAIGFDGRAQSSYTHPPPPF